LKTLATVLDMDFPATAIARLMKCSPQFLRLISKDKRDVAAGFRQRLHIVFRSFGFFEQRGFHGQAA